MRINRRQHTERGDEPQEEHEKYHEEDETQTAPPITTATLAEARITHWKLPQNKIEVEQSSPTRTIKLQSHRDYKTHNWYHWDGKTLFYFTRGIVIRRDWHEPRLSIYI